MCTAEFHLRYRLLSPLAVRNHMSHGNYAVWVCWAKFVPGIAGFRSTPSLPAEHAHAIQSKAPCACELAFEHIITFGTFIASSAENTFSSAGWTEPARHTLCPNMLLQTRSENILSLLFGTRKIDSENEEKNVLLFKLCLHSPMFLVCTRMDERGKQEAMSREKSAMEDKHLAQ